MDIAVITGGKNRLGELFAGALAEMGFAVVVTTRHLGESEIPEGSEVREAALDLGDFDAITRFFDGLEGIRVLVNLAVARYPIKDNEAYGWDDWERELRINLGAAYKCSVEAARQMKKAGFGRIVNIGSVYGHVAVEHGIYPGGMDHTHLPYSISKAGIAHLTRELASMWATHGITVNCLSFGGIEADQPPSFKASYQRKVPQGRMGRYEELVPALRYLIDADSTYTTGQVLLVDGGLTIW